MDIDHYYEEHGQVQARLSIYDAQTRHYTPIAIQDAGALTKFMQLKFGFLNGDGYTSFIMTSESSHLRK